MQNPMQVMPHHAPRRTLSSTITDEITGWITSGRYAPGSHLPAEAELARMFSVALVMASHNRFYAFLQDALRSTIEEVNRRIIAAQPNRDPQLSFQRHLDLFEAIKRGRRGQVRAAIDMHFAAVDAVLQRAAPPPAAILTV